jgi:hypothetical protein
LEVEVPAVVAAVAVVFVPVPLVPLVPVDLPVHPANANVTIRRMARNPFMAGGWASW